MPDRIEIRGLRALGRPEVDGARQVDLPQQRSARIEHLDTGARGDIDPAARVELDAVRVPGRAGREDATAVQAPFGADVEGNEVMRPPVVSDVERAPVRGEREAVRLVEEGRGDREVAGARVVAVERVAQLRPRAEALEVSVARVGEPDAAVAVDDDVVR